MLRSWSPMSAIPMLVAVAFMASACEQAEDNRLYRQSAYIKASNASARDSFGSAMDWWQDTLAVGAISEAGAVGGPNGDQYDDSAPESGAVYLFRRSGVAGSTELEWTQQAYIKASHPAIGDMFGHSVGLHTERMVVGAPHEDSVATGVGGDETLDGASDSGAAYVFRGIGETWGQEAFIKASNTGAGDLFGHSVSLWNDTLVVGAPGEDGRATGVNGDQADCCAMDSGAVYVFRQIDGTWQQEAYIKASNPGEGDGFGWSVDLSYDMLAVGAPNQSVVHMFRRSGASWEQEAYLQGTNTASKDGFGHSVTLWAGDVLAVGAPRENDQGAAYVFYRRPLVGWQQDAHIRASNPDRGDAFGHSVALSGRVLAVGAPAEASAARGVDGNQEDDTAELSGAVYMFRRMDARWEPQAYLKASNSAGNSYVGHSLALSDEGTAAVGAPGEGSAATGIDGDPFDNGAPDSGATFIFEGPQ